jgi:hypothetical protein
MDSDAAMALRLAKEGDQATDQATRLLVLKLDSEYKKEKELCDASERLARELAVQSE